VDAGASIALARWKDRSVAFVADEDEHAVHAIDLSTRKRVASLRVEGRPSQLMVLADGRLIVASRDRSKLVVAEAQGRALASRCTVPTAAEPVALALDAPGQRLLVSSAWGHELAAYRVRDLGKDWRVSVAREPRAVVVSSDGKTAFVAHAVGGHVTAVDLSSRRVRRIELAGQPNPVFKRSRAELMRQLRESGESPERIAQAAEGFDQSTSGQLRTSCQGFALAKSVEPAGRVLAPQVLVDPGNAERRTSGYGEEHISTELPSVAVIDDRTGRALPTSLETAEHVPSAFGTTEAPTECILPRAAIVDPATRTLLVACVGADRVVGYDASAASPVRAQKREWKVAAGPTGIALDPGARRAVVWSQFDRTLTLLPLDKPASEDPEHQPERLAKITLPDDPARALPLKARLGRLLFHASGDVRIARDGRACASCHPDGRDDGLVWATPNGPRRSAMLAGRLSDTAPFSWDGNHPDLEMHVEKTFDRLRGSGGLRSVELDALIAYVKSLPAPPAPVAPDEKLVDRGRALFASKEVGCSSCHAGARFTDQKKHDVGSRASADRATHFDTPSLVHLSGRGPWFHDGRYQTLRELLVASDGKMGKTKHLAERDLDALEAFLKTL
jgi:DNA-binding beta-propeller fold protein YncE/mono/diheme cytochrome c family protein